MRGCASDDCCKFSIPYRIRVFVDAFAIRVARGSMLRAVCCVLYAACCMLRVVCCVLYAACCVLYAVCCVLYAACCMLRAVCCVLRTLSCSDGDLEMCVNVCGTHAVWWQAVVSTGRGAASKANV